jgi:hypothetical protein
VTAIRVASWNLHGNFGGSERLGHMLADLGGADVVLIQESSHRGIKAFCEAAGLDWSVHVRDLFFDLLKARRRAGGRDLDGHNHRTPRSVAIAGRGAPLRGPTAFPDMPLPEKVMAGWLDLGGVRTTVLTYHAPTGVQWQGKKAAQAVRVAEWLTSIEGPVIMGGDFNTPSLDTPDFDQVRTHWHSGEPHLVGAPGDDLLVGPEPLHDLRDALRLLLTAHPERLAAIRDERPSGPLMTSYCTDAAGTNPCRYDAVWLSPHFEVTGVEYHYEAALEAGTDHALVVVDAVLGGVGGVV